jgi:bacteriorhodopsin
MYSGLAVYLSVLCMLSPVCWAFAEGANVLTVSHEMIFYSILDLFAGPIFLFCFLSALQDVEYDDLRLQSSKASGYVEMGLAGLRRPKKRGQCLREN